MSPKDAGGRKEEGLEPVAEQIGQQKRERLCRYAVSAARRERDPAEHRVAHGVQPVNAAAAKKLDLRHEADATASLARPRACAHARSRTTTHVLVQKDARTGAD
eukprot:4537956-Pleurochrysis_carterae.AAC.2